MKLDLFASLDHYEWAIEAPLGKRTRFNFYRDDGRFMVPFQTTHRYIPDEPSQRALIGPLSTCCRLTMAMSAFNQCLKHPKCRTRNTLDFPTRILDVGSNQPGEQRMPALVTGKGLSEPYVALTYAWGGLQPLMLTLERPSDFKRGITMEIFPILLQDPIEVVRAFGIRYLWVDALCKIQPRSDGGQDWIQECTKNIRIDIISNHMIENYGSSRKG